MNAFGRFLFASIAAVSLGIWMNNWAAGITLYSLLAFIDSSLKD